MSSPSKDSKEIWTTIPVGPALLEADLNIPSGAIGLVLFAHGSGSSRFSPRNRFVSNLLNRRGIATLRLDLLTSEEESIDEITRELRFDIELLARRLEGATEWALQHRATQSLKLGYFGASTGAAAALIAASNRPDAIRAVVSRGGRPDLAGRALEVVRAPTLLIVGGADTEVIELNEEAMARMRSAACKLEIVPGATHLFEEPGTLDAVAKLAADWFEHYLSLIDEGKRALG